MEWDTCQCIGEIFSAAFESQECLSVEMAVTRMSSTHSIFIDKYFVKNSQDYFLFFYYF